MEYQYQIITHDLKDNTQHIVVSGMTMDEAAGFLKLLANKKEHDQTVEYVIREIAR